MKRDEWIQSALTNKTAPRRLWFLWDHFLLGTLFLFSFVLMTAGALEKNDLVLVPFALIFLALGLWVYFKSGPEQMKYRKINLGPNDKTTLLNLINITLEKLEWKTLFTDNHLYVQAFRPWQFPIEFYNKGQAIHILISPDKELLILSVHYYHSQAGLWKGRNHRNMKLFEKEIKKLSTTSAIANAG